MERNTLRFDSLDIRNMPGFSGGFRSYEEFHPAVNIIAGPNASGKTTTAKALQHILWPDAANHVELKSLLSIGDEQWTIEKNMSRTLIQREGQDDQLPARPAAEDRFRYLLALHDLIRVEDQKLARLIIRESVGGYDLDQAAEELDYSEKISNRGTNVYKNYSEAVKEYRETFNSQSGLKQRERKLAELQSQLSEAEHADSLIRLFDKYKEYQKRIREWKGWKEQLEEYPKGLDQATGEEGKQLREIEQSLNDKQSNVERLESEIKKAQQTLSEIRLPTSGISDQKIDLLDERAEHIKKVQDKIEDRQNELQELKQKKEEALRSLNVEEGELTPGQINEVDLTKLEKWLHSVYQVKSRRQIKKEELKQLKNGTSDESFSRDRVSEGLRLLKKWLNTSKQTSTSNYPGWLLWGTLILGFITGLGVYLFGANGLWGLVLMGIMALYAFIVKSNRDGDASAIHYIEEYRATGLPAPEKWDVEPVIEMMDALADRLVQINKSEQDEIRIQQLETEIERIEQNDWQSLKSQQEQWRDSLQVLPKFVETNTDTYSNLYWFITQLNRFKGVMDSIRSCQAALEELEERKTSLFDKLNEELADYDIDSPEDSEEALALVRDVERKERKRAEASRTIEQNEQQIKQNKKEMERLQKRADRIYEKFEMQEQDIREVERRLKMLPAYEDVKEQVREARYGKRQALQALQDHPHYQKWKDRLSEMESEEISDKRDHYQQKADKRDSLKENIQDIQIRIDQVREQHDLEEALGEKDEAVDELEEHYRQNVEAITGDLLIQHLKQVTRDQNRPAVFDKAIDLFSRITNGQYELIVDHQQETFRALDTVENRGKALDELSTGTRIQLLLSVRLAFIETQEQSVKLPIMADELLANSDEIRAEAIISALAQMCREGRQIFYFTAQADEVHKWRSYLDESDIGYRIFEIGQASGQGFAFYESYRPKREDFQFTGQVPDLSENETHESYGQKIEPTPFNLLSDPVSQLHLWYIMDDVRVLKRCLERRIQFWGGLRSFINHEGTIRGLDATYYKSLRDLTTFLDRFQELYRQGRPRPINREVLETTDAVTENFIVQVEEKMKEVNSNPKRLLAALREGEVSGFRSAKIDQLEDFLLQEGYIDDSTALSSGQIRSRLQAHLDQLSISTADVDRLLDRLLA